MNLSGCCGRVSTKQGWRRHNHDGGGGGLERGGDRGDPGDYCAQVQRSWRSAQRGQEGSQQTGRDHREQIETGEPRRQLSHLLRQLLSGNSIFRSLRFPKVEKDN